MMTLKIFMKMNQMFSGDKIEIPEIKELVRINIPDEKIHHVFV
jgi:hypothetical protein